MAKLSIQAGLNHTYRKFIYIDLLPTLSFVIDRQMEEKVELSEGGFSGGIVEYSIGFKWLLFSVYVNLEVSK